MLSSIHPLGEAGRGNNYRVTASAFVVGSTVGGAATGLLFGGLGVVVVELLTASSGLLLGQWSPSTTTVSSVALWSRAAVLAVAVLFAALVRVSGMPLPGLARQVNENWLNEFRGWVYGAGFGVQLGAGVTTYVRSAAVPVWLASMVVIGSLGGWFVVVAIAVGATFGVVRGLSILTTRHIRSPEQLLAFHRRLHHSTVAVPITAGVRP